MRAYAIAARWLALLAIAAVLTGCGANDATSENEASRIAPPKAEGSLNPVLPSDKTTLSQEQDALRLEDVSGLWALQEAFNS